MKRQIQRTYSEVYSVLDMLGDEFISKLPNNLYVLIKESKLDEYNPIYSRDIPLEEQDIKKESLSMIALFYLSYWCETEEEKENLKNLFKNNALKLQNKIEVAEKKEETITINEEVKKEINEEVSESINDIESEKVDNSIMLQTKENIFKRILFKIKSFFSKSF